jgi:hypothetical protein
LEDPYSTAPKERSSERRSPYLRKGCG